jgi:hypothetical protein
MKRNILVAVLLAGSLACAAAQWLPNIDAIPGLQPGSVLVLTLTGSASQGAVWGTDVYTTDSSLAAAAVHAGVLADRATGTVIVEVLPGAYSYAGSYRYGVSSANWGSFGKSFRFISSAGKSGFTLSAPSSAPPAAPSSSSPFTPSAPPVQRLYAFGDDGALTRITPIPGIVVYVKVTGSNSGRVWGTNVYTIDSAPSMAAVHAGVVGMGQTAVVKVTILPGRSSYEGSSRNGVSTSSYGSYGASYTIEPAPYAGQIVSMITDPGSVKGISGAAPGQTYIVWITGKASSSGIWGSDIYTSDSSLAAAAVHAGILADGGAGPLIVHVLPGQPSYAGSSRYDVSTASYGSYGMSYSLEPAGR